VKTTWARAAPAGARDPGRPNRDEGAVSAFQTREEPQETVIADAIQRGRLMTMTNEQLALVVSDPDVLHGQVRVRGTRVPVSVLLDCLAAGMTEAEIINEYPSVSVDGIRAAAAYGASLARDEVLPLGSGM
jgi:uncharacterized protein (DUF433 family)